MLVSSQSSSTAWSAGSPSCRMHERRINSFHHRCITIVLGISNHQQWVQHIRMAEVRRRWGDEEIAAEKVRKRQLEWLGHVARMPDHWASAAQVNAVWLAHSAPPKQEEVEGCHKERPQGHRSG